MSRLEYLMREVITGHQKQSDEYLEEPLLMREVIIGHQKQSDEYLEEPLLMREVIIGNQKQSDEYLEEPLLEAARVHADKDDYEDLPRLSPESTHVCEQQEQRVVVEVVGIHPDEGCHQKIIRGHQRPSGLVFEVVRIPP